MDIWALGLIFFEMCLGRRLQKALGVSMASLSPNLLSEELLDSIKEPNMPELLAGMLTRDFAKRMKINDVVEHLKNDQPRFCFSDSLKHRSVSLWGTGRVLINGEGCVALEP